MANLSLVTANRVRNASKNYSVTDTGVAIEAITAGAEARAIGIALKTVAAGEALTILMYGELDGIDLSALAYDAPVYMSDTDGRLSGDAGDSTVDVIIGRVVPAWATTLGTAADKLLRVNFLRI
jgi:hypothetical protein